MLYCYVLQTQIIFDQNVTTVYKESNKYEYTTVLKIQDHMYQYNNYSLLVSVNITEIQVNISSCKHHLIYDINNVVFIHQIKQIFQLAQCQDERSLQLTFITKQPQHIKIHASIALFFQQFITQRHTLYVLGNVTGAFFTQYDKKFTLQTSEPLYLRYYRSHDEQISTQFISSNHLEIKTLKNNLLYVDFLSDSVAVKISLRIEYPYYNLPIGTAAIVPVVQSYYYRTYIFSNLSNSYYGSSVYIRPFDKNIDHMMLPNSELIYYTETQKNFMDQNVSIISTYNLSDYNVVFSNQNNHKSYMFVSIQSSLCNLLINKQMTGCTYYIFDFDSALIKQNQKRKTQPTNNETPNERDQQVNLESNSNQYDNNPPTNNQQKLFADQQINRQYNPTDRIVIYSTDRFYVSFSMDDEMIQHNFIDYEEYYMNGHYNAMPVSAYINRIVQIKTKCHKDVIMAILMQKLIFSNINNISIQTNQNNYFYVDVSANRNQNTFYSLRVQNFNLQELNIYVGFQYKIPSKTIWNKKNEDCKKYVCEIVFNLADVDANSIYINVISNSDLIQTGQINIEIVQYQNNLVPLGLTLDLFIQFKQYNVLMDYTLLRSIVYNGNIYYPLYGYLLIQYYSPYCLKSLNFIQLIQQMYEVYEIDINCVSQEETVDLTIQSVPIWLVQNISTFVGPQYIQESIYFNMQTQSDRLWYLKTNDTTSFNYFRSDFPCNSSDQQNCALITWDSYNMTKITSLNFINVAHVQQTRNVYYKLDFFESVKIIESQPLIFESMKDTYMHFIWDSEPVGACVQYPVINITGIKSGCVIFGENMKQLINITTCQSVLQSHFTVISKDTYINDYQAFDQAYELHFKILTDNGQIEINNEYLCPINQHIQVTDCIQHNNLTFLVPDNITDQIHIQINRKILYEITNIQTRETILVLDTLFSDEFIKMGSLYRIQFKCMQMTIQQDPIHLIFGTQKIVRLTDQLNLQLNPDILYSIKNDQHVKFLQFDINETLTIQMSHDGFDFIQLNLSSQCVIKGDQQVYFKLLMPLQVKIVQVNNLYPQLRGKQIVINFATRQIFLPPLNAYQLNASNQLYLTLPSYEILVNYSVYYKGIESQIELASIIKDIDMVYLQIQYQNQALFSIQDVNFVYNDSDEFGESVAQNKNFIMLQTYMFTFMLVLFFGLIIVNVSFYGKILALNKTILQEKEQIELRKISITKEQCQLLG